MPIAIVDALTISDVKTEEITQKSAKVKWQTNEPAEGSVRFGNTKSLGKTASSPNFVKDHSILLTGLAEDTKYYFEVTSNNGTKLITDNKNGNYYEFTTLPKIPLFVNASIPRYYNEGKKIDITGKSIRLAEINMYVNNNPPRILYADDDGNFLFPSVDLNEGDNKIRFTAQSQAQVIEKTYTITVDTVDPIITINEIPNIVGQERITINGSVSEPVTISFYVKTGEEDTTPPPKVKNLTATRIQANLVELSWDETNINDFEEYIIYRNDIPLGIGSDSSYNDYSDVLANSNQTYIYQVAAMDKNSNIGEKSNPITVKTLAGGRTDLPVEKVNIYESINKPQKTITTNKTFSQEIQLGKEDGFYKIKIEATDIAENKWIYEKEILLDQKDPTITIISPRSNAEIFENYADMVTIRGKTEPGARLYLYVRRTPFGILNDTWDIYGFPDQIQQLPEADLKANCRLDIQGEEQCRTHADYETVADANGYFEFENVDLTSMWAGAFKITEYPTGAPYYDFIRQRELKDFMESNLLFIAVDAAGRKGVEQANYEIVTCWTTDLTWNAKPLIEYQSPTFLNIERLKEGTETIYFYFNFTYLGQGRQSKNTKITNLLVTNACGRGYLEKIDRYNYSCSIIRSCTEKLSPDGKTAYVACPLGRLNGIEKWTDNDWKSFINSVKDEMAFPFKLTLDYDEEYENKTIVRSKRHYLCTEVSYVVDATIINPKKVLPDWLLYDFVDFLNNSINKLNDWVLKIQRILEWTAIGCMATFFVKFITQIYRRITCHYDRFFKKIGGTLQRIGGEKQQEEDVCRQCIRDHENAEVLKKFDSNQDVQDLISDKCLQECYPTCSSVWKSEESLYQTYRWACDRVFGHKTPSRWTETSTDTELFQKLSQGAGCSNDQSVRGRPLRAIDCRSVEDKYPVIKGKYGPDDKCLEIITHGRLGGESSLYHIDEPNPVGENVYVISIADNSKPTIKYTYAIKQNENNYLVPMEQSCEQICNEELTGERVQIGLQTAAGTKITMKNRDQVESTLLPAKKDEEKQIMTYGCITPNECISYRSGEVKQLKIEGEDKYIDVKTAVPMGYTRDCFAPEYVSGNPNTRIECCCINSKAGAMPEFYQPGDVENKDGTFGSQGYENMKWSYRYNKIHYKNKKYNENRYIEGRDQMACFGQNNWLYDGFTTTTGTGNLLIIDPMKEHVASFQCLAISQILNRLTLLRNIMVALENCLLSIRITGKADTGVCKEIFTQYICAFIWKIITWIRDGCLPFGKGIDLAESENEILEFVSVGTKGLWDSVQDSQQELASEYGNAQLNNLIGMGEQEVFRKVCLGAFGYDWEIDANSLLDVAYHVPYATLVQPVLQSREYLTFDPTTYRAKYEYRSSWLVNPGCDLDNYEVYLACVTRNDMHNNGDIDCSKQSDPYGKNCDCLDLPPNKAPPPLFYYQSRGKIKQNQLMQVDSTQITDRIKTSPYRYDHLMFKLNVDRNYIKNKGDITQCFPTGHEDGIFYFPITDYTAREIAGCSVDTTTGEFSCKQGASFFYEEGNAWFTEIKVAHSTITNILNPEEATYNAGDNQQISATVRYSKDDRKQCLVARLFDKDHNTIIRAPRPIELRQGETSGEEIIGTNYIIGEKDISGEGYGFTIEYIDENGRTIPGVAKLRYQPLQKATKDGPGGPLIFTDSDGDGAITISDKSGDTYTYGTTHTIKECNRGGWCEIRLEDIGATIRVDSVYQTTSGKYEFFVEYLGLVKSQASTEPRFYLHLDLRSPKTQNSNCDEVKGTEYDDEQIIVSNGIRQSVDIPIKVLPGQSTKNICDPMKYERNQPLTGEDNQCICGGGGTENCPRKNDKAITEDDFRYCYGLCRKYPRCIFNEPQSMSCVCNQKTNQGKYDCGGVSSGTNAEADFSGVSRVGWYCYEQNGIASCNENPPSGISAGPSDTTPLIVTLESPPPFARYKKGGDITIKATIVDDMLSGNERYEIIVNAKPVYIGPIETTPAEINYQYRVKEEPPASLSIFIIGIDESMTSSNKIVNSQTVHVNVVAIT